MALTFGSESTLTSVATYYSSLAKLDSTHFVEAYYASTGIAVVGTIGSDNSITYGTPSAFSSATIYSMKLAALSSTTFVVVYVASTSSYAKARIGTISGTTISWGTEKTLNGAYTNYILDVKALSSSSFITVYHAGSSPFSARTMVCTISGTTITAGTEYNLTTSTSPINNTIITVLSSTKVVFVYPDTDNSSYGTTRVATISGQTVSFGTKQAFKNANMSYFLASSPIDASTIVITGQNTSANSYRGYSLIATVSGTTVSFGSEYAYNTGYNTQYISIAMVDSTHFFITYTDKNYPSSNSFYGMIIGGTISGTSISYGDESNFRSGTTIENSLAILDSTHLVNSYTINSTSGGQARVIAATLTSSTTHNLELSISQSSSAASTIAKEHQLTTSIAESSEGSYTLTGRTTHLLETGIAQSSTAIALLSQNYTHSLQSDIAQGSTASQSLYQEKGLKTLILPKATVTPQLDLAPRINSGSVDDFNQARTERIAVCSLSSTTHLIAYYYYYSDSVLYGKLKVINTNSTGDTIVGYGGEYTFQAPGAGPEQKLQLIRLSSTKAVLCKSTDSKMAVVDVDQYGYITYGTEYDGYGNDVARIDESHFITYSTSATVYSVSGTTITATTGAASVSSTAGSVCVLDSTHFAFAYSNYTRIGILSGSTINLGTPAYHGLSGWDFASAKVLDSTHYVIAVGGASGGRALIVSVSGDTASCGSSYSFFANGIYGLSVARKSPTSFSLVFTDSGYTIKTVVGAVSGSVIIYTPIKTFSETGAYIDSDCIDGQRYIIAFTTNATYANRTLRYGKVVVCDYGNLVALAGSFSQSSSILDALYYARGLRTAVTQSSSTSVSSAVLRSLQASISQSSTCAESLYRALGLSAQIEQTSYLTPFVQRERLLSLALQGISGQSVSLDDIKALRTVVEQITGVDAHAQAEKELGIAVSQVAELAAQGIRSFNLQTAIQSASSASLHLIRLIELADAMNAASTVQSGLSLEQILSAVISQGSSLYQNAYKQLSLGLPVDQVSSFPLTMEHIAQLVTLIVQESSTDSDLELEHLLAQYIEAKSQATVDFYFVFEAAVSFFQSSSMTVEGRILHGVELVCVIHPEARAYFTAERTAILADQIDAKASVESVFQELLRLYFEWKANLYSGIELSGILYSQLVFSGKINMDQIEFTGELNV